MTKKIPARLATAYEEMLRTGRDSVATTGDMKLMVRFVSPDPTPIFLVAADDVGREEYWYMCHVLGIHYQADGFCTCGVAWVDRDAAGKPVASGCYEKLPNTVEALGTTMTWRERGKVRGIASFLLIERDPKTGHATLGAEVMLGSDPTLVKPNTQIGSILSVRPATVKQRIVAAQILREMGDEFGVFTPDQLLAARQSASGAVN